MELKFIKRKPVKFLHDQLFVDPGFNTGVTVAEVSTHKSYSYDTFILKASVKLMTDQKFNYLWHEFDDMLDMLEPAFVTFDDVDVRGSSLKSLTSAKRGDLLKLDRLLGGYMCLCDLRKITHTQISAINWKGNMNDAQVQNRIKWLTGKEFNNPHIADSFGMSLDAMGIFK